MGVRILNPSGGAEATFSMTNLLGRASFHVTSRSFWSRPRLSSIPMRDIRDRFAPLRCHDQAGREWEENLASLAKIFFRPGAECFFLNESKLLQREKRTVSEEPSSFPVFERIAQGFF